VDKHYLLLAVVDLQTSFQCYWTFRQHLVRWVICSVVVYL